MPTGGWTAVTPDPDYEKRLRRFWPCRGAVWSDDYYYTFDRLCNTSVWNSLFRSQCFRFPTLAGFAITRESGLTGTKIGSLNIGAISIDVTDGMRGGAFIDIWISKIIEWIDTDHPTWGNLDAEILDFLFWPFGIRNPGKFCSWNPESWALESKIQLKESGIPQEEISLPFVNVKSNPEFSFHY